MNFAFAPIPLGTTRPVGANVLEHANLRHPTFHDCGRNCGLSYACRCAKSSFVYKRSFVFGRSDFAQTTLPTSALPRFTQLCMMRGQRPLRRLRISASQKSPVSTFSETDLQFRRYTPADAYIAAELFASGMQHHKMYATHPMTRRMFCRGVERAPEFIEHASTVEGASGGLFLAFSKHGDLAGMVAVRMAENEVDQDLAELSCLAVSEKFRRRGVGTAVVRYASRFARDVCQAKRIYLNTHQSMESAVKFYRGLGFTETVTGSNPVPYIPLEAGTVVRFDRNLSEWDGL